jgi:hypothetical protein
MHMIFASQLRKPSIEGSWPQRNQGSAAREAS